MEQYVARLGNAGALNDDELGVVKAALVGTGVSLGEIFGRLRYPNVVAARRRAIKMLLLVFPDYSFVHVGCLFGLSHTTIVHAVGTYRQAYRKRPAQRRSRAEVMEEFKDQLLAELERDPSLPWGRFIDAGALRAKAKGEAPRWRETMLAMAQKRTEYAMAA